MISNVERWFYLPVTRLSAVLKGIASNNNSDFYCLSFFRSFRLKHNFESNKSTCDNNVFSEEWIILEFNQYLRSVKTVYSPLVPSADLDSSIKAGDGCENTPEKSSTIKVGEHIFCGCSTSMIWTLDGAENKHYICRGEDWMKKFWILNKGGNANN